MASAASSSAPTQREASVLFLSLPPEIRYLVYAELLRPKAPVFIKEITGNYRSFPFQCTEGQLRGPWVLADEKTAEPIRGRGPSLETLSDSDERSRGEGSPPPPQEILQRRDGRSVQQPGPGNQKLWLNIMAACRTTYYETVKMVYDRKFVFQNDGALFAFMSALEPRTRTHLSALEFRDWGNPTPAFSLLVGLENLKSVDIACQFLIGQLVPDERHLPEEPAKLHNVIIDRVAYKVYCGCLHWLRYMFAKGGIPAIKRVLHLPRRRIIGSAYTPFDHVDANEERFWRYLELLLAGNLK